MVNYEVNVYNVNSVELKTKLAEFIKLCIIDTVKVKKQVARLVIIDKTVSITLNEPVEGEIELLRSEVGAVVFEELSFDDLSKYTSKENTDLVFNYLQDFYGEYDRTAKLTTKVLSIVAASPYPKILEDYILGLRGELYKKYTEIFFNTGGS